jgi:hypothetical protein
MISRRSALRIGISAAGLACAGLVLGLGGLRPTRAEGEADPDATIVRQVTVLGILAIPGGKTSDSQLANVLPQLNHLLPHYGFKVLDVHSARIVAGESVKCELGHGFKSTTTLVRPLDEDGKVRLRCELTLDGELQFSANVRTPINQVFFCERPYLSDGSKLLLGLGVRR